MNILYLSYDGLTDSLGQSQVFPYLKGLSRKNHNIIIISCEKNINFNLNKDKILQIINSVNLDSPLRWFPITYTSSPPVLSTIFDIVRIKKLAKQIYKKNNIQIVHCRSYITAIVGLYLKKHYGCKFIFDMRGFFADERVEGSLWNLKNPIYYLVYKYFKNKELQFFSEADYVISLTENGKNEIHSWKQIPNQPIHIETIPCCVDLSLFCENNVNSIDLLRLKEKFNINENSLVLSYLGSIGTWYMLNEMLDFFKRLLLKYPDAKFLFITNEKKEYILNRAGIVGIPYTSIIVTKASRSQVPLYIKLSHISIFFIKPVFSKKASSPTKQGEVMSMGIPVICNSNVGDTDKIINETGSGYVIQNFNIADYDNAVNSIENLLKIPTEQIINVAEKYYSLEKGIELYDKIYNKIGI